MTTINPLARVLDKFYARADWSRAAATYVAAEGLDMKNIVAFAGIIAVIGCTYDGNGHFDIGGSDLSLVVEVFGEDAATTIDLVAWPVNFPNKLATALGFATVLGITNITNPASWAFGKLLPIHRNPLNWLKTGAQGVVILDHRRAPYEIGRALGPLVAEDRFHAAVLKKLLCRPPVAPHNILFRHAGRAVA